MTRLSQEQINERAASFVLFKGTSPRGSLSQFEKCRRKWCNLKKAPWANCVHDHAYEVYREAGIPRVVAYRLAIVRGKVPKDMRKTGVNRG